MQKDQNGRNKNPFKYETGSTYYYDNNKIHSRSVSVKKGKIIEYKMFNEKGEMDASGTKTLDDEDRTIEHIYKSDDYYSKTSYKYNEWGLAVTLVEYNNPSAPNSLLKFKLVKFQE